MTDAPDVLCERRGPLGLITLNRPKALNALTLDMVRVIDPALKEWAADPTVKAVVIRGAGDRAFCAGGDVRALYEAGLAAREGRGSGGFTRDFFREEYSLNRRIKTFPKPYIALLDGFTMGGGVGLSVHGGYRIVTEKTVFSMPETGIGLFPDVGGTFFLPRCPGRIGEYLGLTGARLKAADALYAGVGTHHVPGAELEGLLEDLSSAGWDGDAHAVAEAVIARHAAPAGDPPLGLQRAAIDRCFAGDRVEDILAALGAEGTDWATKTAADLRTLSPTSLKVTLEQVRRGRELSFDEAMALEYRLTQAILARPDFYEGIRAVLIDKDRNPKWSPASLEAVGEAEIAALFDPPQRPELVFVP
nr:enoyl-CoA hydratase/isomerase family protein [Azospirillum sp. SYSU D00513]